MQRRNRREGTSQESQDWDDPQGRALWRLSMILRDIAAQDHVRGEVSGGLVGESQGARSVEGDNTRTLLEPDG